MIISISVASFLTPKWKPSLKLCKFREFSHFFWSVFFELHSFLFPCVFCRILKFSEFWAKSPKNQFWRLLFPEPCRYEWKKIWDPKHFDSQTSKPYAYFICFWDVSFVFISYIFFLCVIGNFPMPPTSRAPKPQYLHHGGSRHGYTRRKRKKKTQINMAEGRRSIYFIFLCVSISSPAHPAFQVRILLFFCLN